MRLAHRFNWHYACPVIVEDGSIMRWCHWCGMRHIEPKEVKHVRPSEASPGRAK